MNSVKNSFLAISLLIFTTVAINKAEAGILVEPTLGYSMSTTTTRLTNTYKYSGLNLGARLGLDYFGFQAGMGYEKTSGSFDTTVVATAYTNDFSRDDLGVFVGYKFPILLRAWVAYYFSAKSTFTSATGAFSKNSYIKGDATEIGLGFTGLPIINVNLVYKMTSFDTQYAASTNTSSAISAPLKSNEILVQVSAPFSFL
jgi:hypothetical protein